MLKEFWFGEGKIHQLRSPVHTECICEDNLLVTQKLVHAISPNVTEGNLLRFCFRINNEPSLRGRSSGGNNLSAYGFSRHFLPPKDNPDGSLSIPTEMNLLFTLTSFTVPVIKGFQVLKVLKLASCCLKDLGTFPKCP